jgi:hypothetical protein
MEMLALAGIFTIEFVALKLFIKYYFNMGLIEFFRGASL